jgi:hypothetical protein
MLIRHMVQGEMDRRERKEWKEAYDLVRRI